MKSRAAWTLPEVLVVSVMTAVIVMIVTTTLASTSRLTNLEAQRGFTQGHMQVTLARIEQLLQSSCAAGVSWLPGSPAQPALLCIHPQSPDPYPDLPAWKNQWSCLLWNSQRKELSLRTCPPAPPSLAGPRTDRPQLPTLAEQAQIAQSTPARQHLLSRNVTFFEYQLEVGPVAHLTLELEILIPRKKTPEKMRIERRLHFRNRV